MYCKSPEAILEPSLILYLLVTQPMSNMFLFYVLLFLLKYKNMFFYVFIPKSMFYNYASHNVKRTN